jgi:fumarate reductase subunit D
MYEKKHEKLLPWPKFIVRLARSILATALVVAIALSLGILGYHVIAHLGWVDSILNASMILTGMGPVDPMKDNAAKLFASAYALFSGVVFLSAMAFMMAPVLHRIVHAFHLSEK